MNTLPAITATVIFLAGVIDDLRSRKFHNWLFLTATAVAFTVMGVSDGWQGLLNGLAGFTAGMIVLLPLVLIKALGAGDMKLLAAAGTLLGWSVVIDVAIYSFVWGALFGLLQVILKRQLRTTVLNMIAILTRKSKTQAIELHTVPFTVGLFLGWLTHLVRIGAWS